jgi:hypothetical protein
MPLVLFWRLWLPACDDFDQQMILTRRKGGRWLRFVLQEQWAGTLDVADTWRRVLADAELADA